MKHNEEALEALIELEDILLGAYDVDGDPVMQYEGTQNCFEKLAKALGQPQWQPIETAAKDGAIIRVWNNSPSHPKYTGAWDAKFMDGEWWLKHFGWCGAHEVTHWKPLPEPPAQDKSTN